MSMKEWAKKEVELACKREAPDRKDGEFDYGCACYESALKAFNSLCDDEHSGFSIKMTQAILNRLIDGQPLTPIEDNDDVWNICSRLKDGSEVYQCKRMSSLFKHVHQDGRISYSDNNRVVGIDIFDLNSVQYQSQLTCSIVDEMFPIEMPYIPPANPFKVHTESFLVNPFKGDFDTVGVFCIITPNNEKIYANRFFKVTSDGFVEITWDEYFSRRKVKEND